ncbi:unnamed protein product [Rotaria sordida]|uniref:Chromo domain-containing protein n=1 Tax=Rotaria sordida TaxID=392033 RepID=A0A818LT54_9BILA|nr:unnamed protein product [Rotaria sordida]CAF0961984.1 unnamed protein product [Rotaria sordida]CAF0988844.1 unnamed protein product [Rotaria sordida]CAF3475515.1 unnamed protein product [Rotaria sordida]CAF3573929.1 unnamed protein product [Rotaria sordida]
MSLSFLSNENNTETFNITKRTTIKLTTSIILDNENIWHDIKSFFNLQNSLILLSIICIIFFFFLLCLMFILIKLMKKKRLYKKQIKSQIKNYTDMNFPFQTKKSSSPIQMGLTSNQITSRGNIISINKDSSSTINPTQNDNKRIWNDEKSNTINPSLTNNDEIETVNEVLAMEERNGKMYYKVNFTGHSPDYTAWVCEEDLIPE